MLRKESLGAEFAKSMDGPSEKAKLLMRSSDQYLRYRCLLPVRGSQQQMDTEVTDLAVM